MNCGMRDVEAGTGFTDAALAIPGFLQELLTLEESLIFSSLGWPRIWLQTAVP